MNFTYLGDDEEESKNNTRILDLVGPWTMQTNVVTRVGHYKFEGHLVMYLVCDAELKGNACEIPDCNEINNQVCIKDEESETGCYDMEENLVDWSDVVAFFYLGVEADAGMPFNLHDTESSGGWLGPYNLILAQNTSKIGEEVEDGSGGIIVDSYSIKYIYSPNTPYLRIPTDSSLISYEDFYTSVGEGAVNNTVVQQRDLDVSNSEYDPYEEYYKSCDYGDVEPILPLAIFNFIQDPSTNYTTESVQVQMLYKLLIHPSNPTWYDIIPVFQKHGAPISGPYCYGDDPEGAYTIDLYYDSLLTYDDDNLKINFYHACIEDLPCIPPPLENCNCTSGQEIHTEPSSETTIEVGDALILGICAFCLTICLLISMFWNYRQYQKYEKLIELDESDFSSDFDDSTSTIEESEQEELVEPLLDDEQSEKLNEEMDCLIE